MYEVRYDNGGFYLVIDGIKGYFNIDNNVGSILNIILTDDQKNKYHQVWKENFKNVNDGNGELILHEKIRLIDSNFPIEKIFIIHSITIVIKSLIEKDNKFYLELALNRCLFEPYEIKLSRCWNMIELIFLKVLILISVKKHLENVVYVSSIIS